MKLIWIAIQRIAKKKEKPPRAKEDFLLQQVEDWNWIQEKIAAHFIKYEIPLNENEDSTDQQNR